MADKWRLIYDDGISMESEKEFKTKQELVTYAQQIKTFGLTIFEALKPSGESFNPFNLVDEIPKKRLNINYHN